MALELRQQLRLTQQLVMTPQLQQAIKLLQLSRLELLEVINQEMEENPVLEDIPEDSSKDASEHDAGDGAGGDSTAERGDSSELKPVTVEETARDDIDWSSYLEEYNAPGPVHFEAEEREVPEYENFLVRRESLNEHLMWQLLLCDVCPKEEEIGSAIIGNLNKDGYLQATVDDIARLTEADISQVEGVLARMQSFDPSGVCARDLPECLLIQINQLGLQDSIVIRIIQDQLKHVENKNYKAIARALGVGIDDVLAAVGVITALEPKPGRQFSEEEPQYISPDVFVHKMGDEFVIVLNEDGLPKLRISAFYREALHNKGDEFSSPTRDYIQNKLRSAVWLIRSIHQRQRTIYKVVESIVGFQREFLEKGIGYLKPMVLRDVAADIGMHESTVSRVTTNKYVHTPQGIYELKFFFNSSIGRLDGDDIASASVKEKIRQIVESEDPAKPYSDKKMVDILKASNISIARRTVAKYREMLGVLPSNKRKKV
jgi:RNA polymerase sigma-54 factor